MSLNGWIDLRSDTITQPTEAMRRAMYEAEVGDDVYREDPTVRRLEELAAAMLGKEAGLLVTSGTQGNLAAMLAQAGRGDEVILGNRSHIHIFEQGGIAALGGIHPRPVPNQPDGTLRLEDIRAVIRPENIHFPRSRVVALENTHNLCHGSPLSVAYTQAVADLARAHNLRLHVDGARIFNAAIALGVPARALAAPADSLMFSLSKGLAAPIGSVLVGDRDFIEEARRARKVLGGGMRQAGVIAAAGIVALTQMVDRLAEDHARARRLAEALANIPGLHVDLDRVRTNIFYVELDAPYDAGAFRQALEAHRVRVLALDSRTIRVVTHYHITDEDVDRAIPAFQAALQQIQTHG